MTLRRARAIVVVLFVLAITTPGLCFMPAAAGDGAHDCCGAGLRAAAPSCCMASAALSQPGGAVAKAHLTTSFVAVASIAGVGPLPSTLSIEMAAIGRRPAHPPPLVPLLRV